ncbi:unnamed protein product [Rotaria sp. Silwood2]|nr:unnamed protein product [Rotaria sp. Silwood2]
MKRGLETIKREHGRKKLADGKTIGGKNCLSVHNILRLQMAFPSTIRKSKHDLDLLFKGSWAIFWHKYSTNDDPHHDYCRDIFNVMYGYRGYYTDQSMIHFDNNRLHTETKENNRKRRKAAARVLIQNDDEEENNDTIINRVDQIDDDYNDTNPVTEASSEDNDTTTDSDEHVTDDNDTISSNDQSLDDDYGYYNPKDKRTWIEEQYVTFYKAFLL